MLFLRALIAPLYLVAVSVLGLAASLGITTFFFQGVLGQDDLTYYVPFAAAVLLVALGSDYNVFVAGRIWEEARAMRLREAIAVATPSAAQGGDRRRASRWRQASRCWSIVPLRSFREFAFVMARRRAHRHVPRALAARARADVAVRRARLVARPPDAQAVGRRVRSI